MDTEQTDAPNIETLSTGKKIVYSSIPLLLLLIVSEVGGWAYYSFMRDRDQGTPDSLPLVNLAELMRSGNFDHRRQMFVDYFAFDATLGVRFKPSVWAYGLEPDDEFLPRVATTHRLAIDRYGYVSHVSDPDRRTDYVAMANDSKAYRILVSGASTASGWGASSNENIWSARLERMLQDWASKNAFPYENIHVVNGSVFGFRVSQELKRFQEEMVYLNPDLVIMYNGSSEHPTYVGNPVDFATRGEQYQLMDRANLGPVRESALVLPYLRHFVASVREADRPEPKTVYAYKARDYLRLSSPDLYFSKVRQFKATCDSEGILLMHCLQPTMGIGNKRLSKEEESLKSYMGSTFYPRSWDEYLDAERQFYDSVKSQMTEPWQFDLTALFDEVSEQAYFDPRHLNDRGNELVAERMFHEVVQVLNESLSGRARSDAL